MKGFNNLDLFFKSDLLRKQAQYLVSTGYYHYTVKLFTWDRFFIEQYYDNEQEKITRITLAGKTDMEKYLKDISLSDLGLPVIL
jgi:hypothetical protein